MNEKPLPKTMISLIKKDPKTGEYAPVFVDTFKNLNHAALISNEKILLEIYLD